MRGNVDRTGLDRAMEDLRDAFLILANYSVVVVPEKEEEEEEGTMEWRRKRRNEERRPFPEVALGTALSRLVSNREDSGEGRRDRRRKPPRTGNNGSAREFESMFPRIARYREEHSDCMVLKSYKKDPQVRERERKIHGMVIAYSSYPDSYKETARVGI